MVNGMKMSRLMQTLSDLSIRERRFLFSIAELAMIFPEKPVTLEKSLQRAVGSGILQRIAPGIYFNPHSRAYETRYLAEYLALALRPGALSYLSLESMLSEYGAISQIPMRLTVMTTGASGEYHTPWGVIEFTHTARSPAEVLKRCRRIGDRPLPGATLSAAISDLRRVGRNVNLIDWDQVKEIGDEQEVHGAH